jgi:hypothetical protein
MAVGDGAEREPVALAPDHDQARQLEAVRLVQRVRDGTASRVNRSHRWIARAMRPTATLPNLPEHTMAW